MKKSWIIAIVIMIFLAFFVLMILPGLMFTSAMPSIDDVPLDKKVANKLVDDFNRYAKIYEMDDCTRYTKSINGIFVRTVEKIEEQEDGYGDYYKDVLTKQNIDFATFEDFRTRLEESRLREYQKVNQYSVFIVDGFMDSIWGYLYVHDNKPAPKESLSIKGHTIHVVKGLGDNWYQIGRS
ncbi:MAG: hypothetical protein ACO3EE_10475 [Flavobacteriales bacterium]